MWKLHKISVKEAGLYFGWQEHLVFSITLSLEHSSANAD